MATVLIVEPDATGHRMVLYVRLIVEEALARGFDVVLLTTVAAMHHDACKSVLAEFGDRLAVATMPGVSQGGKSRFGLFRSQYRRLRAFQAGYRAVSRCQRVDFVYIPYFNYIDKIIGWYGNPFDGVPFGGMIVAAKFHHFRYGIAGSRGKQDVVNELLFRAALRIRSLALLTSIDEPLTEFVKQSMSQHVEKVRYVPDVSTIRHPADRRSARAVYGFSSTDFVILLYGSISPRKGIEKILRLFSDKDLPSNIRLLMIGSQEESAKKMIEAFLAKYPERRSRMCVVDRFVTEVEEGQAFASADVVWLCYENFSGMSGVLIQSAQSGVPVVTSGYGLIERYREKYGLGIRWSDFVDGQRGENRIDWNRLLESSRSVFCSPRLQRFAEQHTPQAFGRNVVDAIVAATKGALR
ncbi:glycosyltransferase [Burkholderia vietnamiensis]|uniref:glycosyltransferase n=1 Tax=Burkholderia vietnamiensis TaxID=60552 RepID=UPI0026562C72|nr:glycosyltransferase [Burkholderia vietnamiensis]MDN8037769.1 glycosyltransferase [Burkholderia vietnamiensis]